MGEAGVMPLPRQSDGSASQLFHTTLGIPATLLRPDHGRGLTYGVHALDKAQQLSVEDQLPQFLSTHTLIELEVTYGRVSKWVVRVRLDATCDLCLAITDTYFVKTVWVNNRTDTHTTLNRSRYTSPEGHV